MIKRLPNRNIQIIVFWILLFLSIVSIIIIKISPLKNIPSSQIPLLYWFPYGYEFGEIMFNLSIGYIVSCIFYVIVVFIPDYQKRQSAMSIINKDIIIIAEAMNLHIHYLLEKNNITTKFDILTESDFIAIPKLTNNKMSFYYQYKEENSTTYVKMYTGYYTELERFTDVKNLITQKVDKLFNIPSIIYVDYELIETLSNISNSSFHSLIPYINKYPDLNCPDFSKDVYRYYLLLKELLRYTKIKEYTFDQQPTDCWHERTLEEREYASST